MTQQHTQAADPVNVNIFSPSPARLSVSPLTCVSLKFMLKVSSFLLVFCPCLSVLSIRKTLLLQIKRCSPCVYNNSVCFNRSRSTMKNTYKPDFLWTWEEKNIPGSYLNTYGYLMSVIDEPLYEELEMIVSC